MVRNFKMHNNVKVWLLLALGTKHTKRMPDVMLPVVTVVTVEVMAPVLERKIEVG